MSETAANHIDHMLAGIITETMHEHGLETGRTWTETDRDGITERRLVTIHAYAGNTEIRARRIHADELTITAHSGDRLTGLATICIMPPGDMLRDRIHRALDVVAPTPYGREPLTRIRSVCQGEGVEWIAGDPEGIHCRTCGKHPDTAMHEFRYEYTGPRRYRLDRIDSDESRELDPRLAWQWDHGTSTIASIARQLGVTARPETLRINID